ncbi:hypothetical protein [Streptomyces sp. NPDC049585]|uniref:hypothetical protein n=1 Tax=Streptomyces sp. NPDC049585 TaxID=3155154 RepID=UPI00341E5621
MSADKELIVPSGIPQFTGNVDTLVSDAKTLTSDAKLFRDSGASVHSTFQGLSACYKAPEADRLFATTAPVATKSSAFASDLEKVSGALSTYATEIRPLAKKLGDLRDEAVAFVESVQGDNHWRRDKKKVEHNNSLWHSVNATVAAFHDAERACHDKIVALVGGEKLVVDDGSHKPNMYGYKASDLDHAEETPWGSMAEREYTGIAWLGHQVKSFVWDGFIVDGVWGTVKGLGTLVGTDGWDKAGEAWTGLGKLATGVVISCTPLSGAYWAARDDQLPGWLRDSRTAVKETGKALVAYDQWGKNPARAAGGVTFNVLTTVFTGGAGAAGKGGAVAKTVSALGKAGRIVDPMTYVGKAGRFAFVKVGDAMSGLKNLRVGSTVHLTEETFKLPEQGATLPKRPASLPESAVPFLDPKNKVVYLDKESGKLFNEHGKELQPPKKELSAEERAAEAAKSPGRQPQHSTVSEHEKVPVAAGVHAGGDATTAAGHGGEHIPTHGAEGHAAGGGIGGHTPGGAAQHARDGGAGSHGGHASPHSGSGAGGHDIPGSGHGTSPRPGHDTVPSGTGGHNTSGHGGHGDSPSSPHEPTVPHHGDEVPPRDGGGHGGEHEAQAGNAHEGDGPHAPGEHRTENAGHGGGGEHEGAGKHAHDGPASAGAESGWGGAGWVEVPTNAEDLAIHNAAAKYYEHVRGTPNSYDLPRISEHTGIDQSVLTKVKTHLFRAQHEVATGPGAENVKRGAFTPYPHIVELWKGATEGTLSKAQKTRFRQLMAHEYVESQLMKAGMPYISPNPGAWVPDGAGGWDKARMTPGSVLDFGAHEVAPKEIGGGLKHWKRSLGLKIPSITIARDLSNLDDIVKSAKEQLNKKGWNLK